MKSGASRWGLILWFNFRKSNGEGAEGHFSSVKWKITISFNTDFGKTGGGIRRLNRFPFTNF